MFSILIHADLYELLRGSSRALRTRVRKTMLRLRDGQWSGGTRVKRLRGVNRPLFEARTDRGDRLLFTAIRSADPSHPDRLATYLQVWDVVSHDAVNRVARRNRSAEAEFLEFSAEEQFDIYEPPPVPEATLDAFPSEDGVDPLLHFLLPPDGYTPRSDEGITGGVRWFQTPGAMLADDDEFQRIIDHEGAGLELKLTRDQYNVLLAPGPALVAGSAGSGKTTIAVHRLADASTADSPLRTLYISYSRWLVEHARSLYHDVLAARGQTAPSPVFTTFTDLYLRLIPAESREKLDAAGGLADSAAFRSWFARLNLRMDAALVWEEIRSILKGACTNIGKTMLDEGEYLDLGRKRAPLFVDERPEIYRTALRYQQWLADRGRQDQIDLCRNAFRELRRGHHKRFDVVVCDEVQDLTELEMAFVLSLSNDPSLPGMMLSGDTQQIINPSGFRWAEVRQAILKANRGRSGPPLLRLRRNFRSVRPVVELANSVLLLRRDIYGRSDEDDLEEAVLEGPTPIQVLDSDARFFEAIRDFGPRCAVIVFSEQHREALQKELATTRIFHVQEAKGLEFDTVVLWKILDADPALLDRFLRADHRLERDARFRHFLQHLYVAITRARRHVAVFEGSEAHPFWNSGRFQNRLEHEQASTLERLFRQSGSPEDWIKEGEYFFERNRYRQAAECYRRGGLPRKENEALAMFAESTEDWMGALKIWQQLGNLERQATLLERMSRFAEALEIYRKLGNLDRVQSIEILLLEKHGRWAEAGQRWEALGRTDDAARCYHKSGNRARALSFEAARAESEKNWKRAAECWAEIQSWEAAARCWRKAKNPIQSALAAARHAESQRDWAAAASAYRRAGQRRKAGECRARSLESSGEFAQAAKLLERMKEYGDAIRLYRKIGDSDAIERLEISQLDFSEPQTKKILALESKQKLQAAANIAAKRRAVVRATLRKKLPVTKRHEFWDELDELQIIEGRCRARLAELNADWDKAVYHWRRAYMQDAADAAESKAIELIADPAARAKRWIKFGDYEKAAESFGQAGDTRNQQIATARRLEMRQEWASAAAIWRSLGDAFNEAFCLAQLHDTHNEPHSAVVQGELF
jgi:DNA helicase-2/ATP-dependent DNA helicase PcrA